mgnify:CR=1 FL=1
MGRTVEHIKIVEEDLSKGAVASKNSPYPMAGIHALHGIAAIFYEQAWDLWYNRRRRAFCYSTSNVYGNAIRHARCQKAVFVFPVCGKAKEKRREDLERITSGYGTQLRMNWSIQTEGSDKCAFSAVQVLYQIYKLNLSFYSKKTSTSKVGDELRLLLT